MIKFCSVEFEEKFSKIDKIPQIVFSGSFHYISIFCSKAFF